MDYSTSYKKGKPVVRRGRKATGLYKRLPGCQHCF